MKKTLATVITAVAVMLSGVVLTTPAEAKVKVPPESALLVWLGSPTITTDSRGSCNLYVNPKVGWYRHPNPKRPRLVKAHYLRIQTRIEVRAGLGGTLWKPLAKESYKTSKYRYPDGGLGRGLAWDVPLGTTVGAGSLDYRTRVIVRVVRDVKFSPVDVTIWKGSYTSAPWYGCFNPGGA